MGKVEINPQTEAKINADVNKSNPYLDSIKSNFEAGQKQNQEVQGISPYYTPSSLPQNIFKSQENWEKYKPYFEGKAFAPTDEASRQDLRALYQGDAPAIFNSIGQGLSTFGTATLSGLAAIPTALVGLVGGATGLVDSNKTGWEGFASTFTNNPVMKGLNDINTYLASEVMPVYRRDEREATVGQYVSSIGFFNDLMNGLGFLASSLVGAGAISKASSLLTKGVSSGLAKSAMNSMRAGQIGNNTFTKAITGVQSTINNSDNLVGAFLQRAGEASIEAYGVEDEIKSQLQPLVDSGRMTKDEMDRRIQRAKLMTFTGNMFLAPIDAFQYNKLFGTSKKVVKDGVQELISDAGLNPIIKQNGKYIAKKATYGDKTRTFAKDVSINALSEAFEEDYQNALSKASKNIALSNGDKDIYNSFVSQMNKMVSQYGEDFFSTDTWKARLLGGLLGGGSAAWLAKGQIRKTEANTQQAVDRLNQTTVDKSQIPLLNPELAPSDELRNSLKQKLPKSVTEKFEKVKAEGSPKAKKFAQDIEDKISNFQGISSIKGLQDEANKKGLHFTKDELESIRQAQRESVKERFTPQQLGLEKENWSDYTQNENDKKEVSQALNNWRKNAAKQDYIGRENTKLIASLNKMTDKNAIENTLKKIEKNKQEFYKASNSLFVKEPSPEIQALQGSLEFSKQRLDKLKQSKLPENKKTELMQGFLDEQESLRTQIEEMSKDESNYKWTLNENKIKNYTKGLEYEFAKQQVQQNRSLSPKEKEASWDSLHRQQIYHQVKANVDAGIYNAYKEEIDINLKESDPKKILEITGADTVEEGKKMLEKTGKMIEDAKAIADFIKSNAITSVLPSNIQDYIMSVLARQKVNGERIEELTSQINNLQNLNEARKTSRGIPTQGEGINTDSISSMIKNIEQSIASITKDQFDLTGGLDILTEFNQAKTKNPDAIYKADEEVKSVMAEIEAQRKALESRGKKGIEKEFDDLKAEFETPEFKVFNAAKKQIETKRAELKQKIENNDKILSNIKAIKKDIDSLEKEGKALIKERDNELNSIKSEKTNMLLKEFNSFKAKVYELEEAIMWLNMEKALANIKINELDKPLNQVVSDEEIEAFNKIRLSAKKYEEPISDKTEELEALKATHPTWFTNLDSASKAINQDIELSQDEIDSNNKLKDISVKLKDITDDIIAYNQQIEASNNSLQDINGIDEEISQEESALEDELPDDYKLKVQRGKELRSRLESINKEEGLYNQAKELKNKITEYENVPFDADAKLKIEALENKYKPVLNKLDVVSKKMEQYKDKTDVSSRLQLGKLNAQLKKIDDDLSNYYEELSKINPEDKYNSELESLNYQLEQVTNQINQIEPDTNEQEIQALDAKKQELEGRKRDITYGQRTQELSTTVEQVGELETKKSELQKELSSKKTQLEREERYAGLNSNEFQDLKEAQVFHKKHTEEQERLARIFDKVTDPTSKYFKKLQQQAQIAEEEDLSLLSAYKQYSTEAKAIDIKRKREYAQIKKEYHNVLNRIGGKFKKQVKDYIDYYTILSKSQEDKNKELLDKVVSIAKEQADNGLDLVLSSIEGLKEDNETLKAVDNILNAVNGRVSNKNLKQQLPTLESYVNGEEFKAVPRKKAFVESTLDKIQQLANELNNVPIEEANVESLKNNLEMMQYNLTQQLEGIDMANGELLKSKEGIDIRARISALNNFLKNLEAYSKEQEELITNLRNNGNQGETETFSGDLNNAGFVADTVIRTTGNSTEATKNSSESQGRWAEALWNNWYKKGDVLIASVNGEIITTKWADSNHNPYKFDSKGKISETGLEVESVIPDPSQPAYWHGNDALRDKIISNINSSFPDASEERKNKLIKVASFLKDTLYEDDVFLSQTLEDELNKLEELRNKIKSGETILDIKDQSYGIFSQSQSKSDIKDFFNSYSLTISAGQGLPGIPAFRSSPGVLYAISKDEGLKRAIPVYTRRLNEISTNEGVDNPIDMIINMIKFTAFNENKNTPQVTLINNGQAVGNKTSVLPMKPGVPGMIASLVYWNRDEGTKTTLYIDFPTATLHYGETDSLVIDEATDEEWNKFKEFLKKKPLNVSNALLKNTKEYYHPVSFNPETGEMQVKKYPSYESFLRGQKPIGENNWAYKNSVLYVPTGANRIPFTNAYFKIGEASKPKEIINETTGNEDLNSSGNDWGDFSASDILGSVAKTVSGGDWANVNKKETNEDDAWASAANKQKDLKKPKVETPAETVTESEEDDMFNALQKATPTNNDSVNPWGRLNLNNVKELVSAEEEIKIVKQLLGDNVTAKAIANLGDGRLFGMLATNGDILFSKMTEKGTAYHEAFHAVSQMYLTESERNSLYNELRKRKGEGNTKWSGDDSFKPYSQFTNEEAEEYLAEEFREYSLSNGKLEIPQPKQKSIFRKIYDLLLSLFGINKPSILEMYSKIKGGTFRNIDAKSLPVTKLGRLKDMGAADSQEALQALHYYFIDELLKKGTLREALSNEVGFNEIFHSSFMRFTGVLYANKTENGTFVSSSVELYNKKYAKADDKDKPKLRAKIIALQKKQETLRNYLTQNVKRTKLATGVFLYSGDLVEQYKKYLGKYNVKFEENDFVNDEGNTGGKGSDSFKESIYFDEKDKMPNDVKIILSGLPSKELGSSLGLFKTEEYNRIANILGRLLSNTPARWDMIKAKLEKEASTSKELWLSELCKQLTKEGVKYEPLRTNFVNHFSKAKYKHLVFNIEYNGEQAFGHFVEGNKEKIIAGVVSKWRNTFGKIKPQFDAFFKAYKKDPKPFLGKDYNFWSEVLGMDIPWSKLPNDIKTKVDDILRGTQTSLIGSIVSNIMSSKSVSNPFEKGGITDSKGEQTDIESKVRKIIELIYPYTDYSNDNSLYNADGKKVYAISLNHYLSQMFNEINHWIDNPQGTIAETLRREMPQLYHINSENSKWLKMIEAGHKISVDILSGAQREGDFSGQSFGDLDIASTAILNMFATLSGNYNFIRSSDRTIENVFTIDRADSLQAELEMPTDIKQATRWMRGYLQDELELVKFYGENPDLMNEEIQQIPTANKFIGRTKELRIFKDILGEGLSNKLIAEPTSIEAITKYSSEIDKAIEDYFNSTLEDLKQTLEDIGVTEKNVSFSEFGYDWDLGIEVINIKSAIAKIEQLKLISGDIGIFKDANDSFKRFGTQNSSKESARYDEDFFNSLNSDLGKRADGTNINSTDSIVPGDDPGLGYRYDSEGGKRREHSLKGKYRFIKGINSKGKEQIGEPDQNTLPLYIDFMEEVFEKSILEDAKEVGLKLSKEQLKDKVDALVSPYLGMKISDGGGYIQLNSFRQFEMMAGTWNDEKETLYHDLYFYYNQGLPAPLDIQTTAFAVLKPQMVAPSYVERNGRRVMIGDNFKLSLAPLLPIRTFIGGVEQKSPLDIIRGEMEANGEDVLVSSEAKKYFGFTKEFSWKYFTTQQRQSSEYHNDVTVGTQQQKITFANMFNKEGRFKTLASQKAFEDYNNAKNEIIRRGFNNLMSELGADVRVGKELKSVYIKDFDKAKAKIVEAAISREMPENVIQMLEQLDSFGGYIDLTPAKAKIEPILNSLVDKAVIKEKRSGEKLAQVSTRGFFQEGDDFLRFYRPLKDKDGKYIETLPAEIAVPLPESLIPYLQKFGSLDAFNVLVQSTIDLADEGKEPEMTPQQKAVLELITTVGFRIPSQMFSSTQYVRIKRFLPPSFKGIVMFKEIVAIAGSDFDIDTFNMYAANFSFNDEGILVKHEGGFKKWAREWMRDNSTSDITKGFDELVHNRRRETTIKRQELLQLLDRTYRRQQNALKKIYKKESVKQLTDEQKESLLDYKKRIALISSLKSELAGNLRGSRVLEVEALKDELKEVDSYINRTGDKESLSDVQAGLSKAIADLESEVSKMNLILSSLEKNTAPLVVKFNEITTLIETLKTQESEYIDKNLKSVYEAQSEMGKKTLGELQNIALQSQITMLKQIENVRMLMSPTDDSSIKNHKLAKDSRRNVSYAEAVTFGINLKKKRDYIESKQGVGQIAGHITGKVNAQRERWKFTLPTEAFVFPHTIPNSLASALDVEGNNIMETMSAFLTANVDAGKDPYIQALNGTLDTNDTYMLLLSMGASKDWAVDFMSYDVIKESNLRDRNRKAIFLNKIPQANEDFFKQELGKYYDDSINKILNELDNAKTDKDKQTLRLKLDERLGQFKQYKTVESMKHDLKKEQILDLFYFYKFLGKQYRAKLKSEEPDTRGMGKNLNSLESQLNLRNEVVENNFIIPERQMNSFISNLKGVQQQAHSLLSNFYLTANKDLKWVDKLKDLKIGYGKVGGMDAQRVSDLIDNALVTVLFKKQLELKPDLMQGDNSVARRIFDIQNSDSPLKDNEFIKNFYVQLATDNINWDSLIFNGQGNKADFVDAMVDKLYEVKDYDGQLFNDIILLAIAQNGFNQSFGSFTNIIPSDITVDILKSIIDKGYHKTITIEDIFKQVALENPYILKVGKKARTKYDLPYYTTLDKLKGEGRMPYKVEFYETEGKVEEPLYSFNYFGSYPKAIRINEKQFQIDSKEQEPFEGLDAEMSALLNSLGFTVSNVPFINANGMDATAMVDYLSQTVQVVKGKQKLDTLPEEAAHIWFTMIPEDSQLKKRLLDVIPTYQEYQEVKEAYGNVYDNERSIREEAIGKLLAKGIVGSFKSEQHKTLFERVWDWVTSFFKSNPDIFEKLGKQIRREAIVAKKNQDQSNKDLETTDDIIDILRSRGVIKYECV